jgi:hypothetical protein
VNAVNTEFKINLAYDDDALVWFATSDDIPGLVLESGSLDALIERVRFAVPELLSLNTPKLLGTAISISANRIIRVGA